MGRHRKKPSELPARVYEHHGAVSYVDPNGKWHRLGKTWDRAAKAEWIRLTTGSAPEHTVAAMLDEFMKHAAEMVRIGKRAPRTYDDNIAEAENLKLVFGRMHYRDVTSKHCATYLRKRCDKNGEPAPVRANREMSLLSSAYSWAMGDDRFEVDNNPCYGVRKNTETPRDEYVETARLRKFSREYAPDWMRGYILLKRLGALRQGDMLRLGRANMTDRGIEYTIGKAKKKQILRWSWALRIVVGWLLRLHGDTPRLILFPSRFGTPMSKKGFASAWQRAMQAFEADGHRRFWEHDIRAKSSSDAESETRAKELLGHTANSRTTSRHYRRAPTKVKPFR